MCCICNSVLFNLLCIWINETNIQIQLHFEKFLECLEECWREMLVLHATIGVCVCVCVCVCVSV